MDDIDAQETDPALDADGYLRMSTSSDQPPLSPTYTNCAPLASVEEVTETGDRPYYVNQRSLPSEKGSEFEMQPLLSSGGSARASTSERRSSIPEEVAPGFVKGGSPSQVHTQAEVHQPDDSDSGHSSSYAPGTSPTDNSGYLLPKAYEAAAAASESSGPSGSVAAGTVGGKAEGGQEQKDMRDSALSPTNSVFNPDYLTNCFPPPDYRLVVEDEKPKQDLPV